MRPVFIGGCPRSGTTILATALGAHPGCGSVPESQFKLEALRGSVPDSGPASRSRALVRRLRAPAFESWTGALERTGVATLEECGSYGEAVERLVRAYLALAGKPDAAVWIDATPSNKNGFPTLLDLFPEAKAIHIVRDGRAVAASVMRRDWGPNTAFTAAYWWTGHLAHGLAAEAALPPDRIRRVHYEAFVRSPAETLRELSEWIGLEYSDRMLDASAYAPGSRSVAFNPLTTSAPVAARADAWRQDLSAREIEMFEAGSREMLRYLGYAMDFGLAARPATSCERARIAATEGWRGAVREVGFHLRRALWRSRLRRSGPR